MAIYYDVWKPPRGDEASRLVYIRKDLIPKIRFDDLKLSLELRCYHDANLGKLTMMEILYKVRGRKKRVACWSRLVRLMMKCWYSHTMQDFELERKVLGEKAHRRIKELEGQVSRGSGTYYCPRINTICFVAAIASLTE